MRYARPHVKKFWDFAYKRAIGVSMVTFALLLAVGFIFNVVLGPLIGSEYYIYVAFWSLLIAIMAFVFSSNIAGAHVLSSRYMSKKEYRQHSVFMWLWILIVAMAAMVFVAPLDIISGLSSPVLLLSYGGILLAAYLATAGLFKVYYNEVAYGAAVLILMFLVTYLSPGSAMLSSIPGQTTLILSAMTIVVVSGFVGLMLIMDSTRKFITYFDRSV